MLLASLNVALLAYVQPSAFASGRTAARAQTPRTCVEMARGQPPAFMDPNRQAMSGGGPPLMDDGIPAFTLMVRNPAIGLWYPVSVMKGDKPTRALVDAIANNGLGSDMAKGQLDEGLAKSIFEPQQHKKLVEAVLKQYKVLKTGKDNLQWGYKIVDKYLAQKVKEGAIAELKVQIVTREMTADKVDQVQNAVAKTAENVWKALTGDGKQAEKKE